MHSANIDYLMKKNSTKTWVAKPWRVHTLGETNYRTEEAMRQATELNLFWINYLCFLKHRECCFAELSAYKQSKTYKTLLSSHLNINSTLLFCSVDTSSIPPYISVIAGTFCNFIKYFSCSSPKHKDEQFYLQCNSWIMRIFFRCTVI